MEIVGLVPNSTIDFPKVLSAVIFTRGCNMNCFFCHNRELLNPSAALMPEEEVWEFLNKRKKFLDGVVISGGEPTLQTDLKQFITKIRYLGYRIKLDTNGTAPKIIKELIDSKLLDYIAVDYKAPFERYDEICEYKYVENIKRTFDILAKSESNWEARTTAIPHILKEEYLKMAKEALQFPKYVINEYKTPKFFLEKDKLRLNMKPYSAEELNKIRKAVQKIQKNILVEGT